VPLLRLPLNGSQSSAVRCIFESNHDERIAKMSIRDWFTPRWRHSDPEVRKSAIKRLTDRNALVSIAKSDEDGDVRHIAKIRLIELQEGVKLDY
jgi:hypothetical protein